MSTENRLTDLAERKQLLVMQSDLHRAVLQAEVANVSARLVSVVQMREQLPGKPWWMVGGVAAGFLAMRQWRTALKMFPVGLAIWRWWKNIPHG